MSAAEKRTYLGDGVYVSFDGYQFWLTTWDGISDTNRIALEPAVWNALKLHIAVNYERPPEASP